MRDELSTCVASESTCAAAPGALGLIAVTFQVGTAADRRTSNVQPRWVMVPDLSITDCRVGMSTLAVEARIPPYWASITCSVAATPPVSRPAACDAMAGSIPSADSRAPAAATPAWAASQLPNASIIRVATSFTAPWVSLPSALHGVVAGSWGVADVWLEAAAVADGIDELLAEDADALGDGDVDVGDVLAEPLGAAQPATNNADVPSSSPRLSNVMHPVSTSRPKRISWPPVGHFRPRIGWWFVSRPYGASREAILNAAEMLIRERGVGAMSVADIIAASETSAGAIYHHFESKQDIVLAIAERALARPIEAAIQETGPVTPAELFRLAARRVAAEAETAPLLLQVWAGAAGDERLRNLLRDRAGGLPVGVAAHVEQWCETHGYGGDSVAVASLLVGLVMGMVIQSSLFDDFVADDYVALAVEGLSRLGQA